MSAAVAQPASPKPAAGTAVKPLPATPSAQTATVRLKSAPAPLNTTIAEQVFEAATGLGDGWRDFGWAPRELAPGKPAKLDVAGRGGWMLSKPGFVGAGTALRVRYQAVASTMDALEVRLGSSRAGVFPWVALAPELRQSIANGWTEALVPLRLLNPEKLSFEQVLVRAGKPTGHEPVWIADIALMRATADAASAVSAAASTVSVSPAVPAAPAAAGGGRRARFVVDCSAKSRPISPWIYGTAASEGEMGETARRWGGNPSTRYNWQLGNAWNTGADWFFRNVDYTGDPKFNYDYELQGNLEHKRLTALTVPMIGWVAKDTTSYSFPVSVFGPQQAVAPELPDAGNGRDPQGKEIKPGDPKRTSIAAPPEFIGKWISTIRAKDKTRGRSVQIVFLDNEPALWHVNHRDVHPDPVGYDELLTRSVAYATAVRKADPGVLIAGPSEWGWPAYFFSAIDGVVGFNVAPDRKAHGDVPLLPWWLSKMRAREKASGLKLLDLLDVHYYPAADGIGVEGSGATDKATNALRIRSTRSLWDPSYVDESWVGQPVELIPRLRRWVESSAPGLGISIGEYSFGAAGHMSGGLAQAEALGRFGTEGLTAAFYWRSPPKDSPVFWAFRAYRNFDGAGGHFLEQSVPVIATGERASLFVSRSADNGHLVAVLLNLDPDDTLAAEIDLSRCGASFAEHAFTYTGAASGFTPGAASQPTGAVLARRAAPYSISVLDWTAPQPAH
jgi:hypothetical protein